MSRITAFLRQLHLKLFQVLKYNILEFISLSDELVPVKYGMIIWSLGGNFLNYFVLAVIVRDLFYNQPIRRKYIQSRYHVLSLIC